MVLKTHMTWPEKVFDCRPPGNLWKWPPLPRIFWSNPPSLTQMLPSKSAWTGSVCCSTNSEFKVSYCELWVWNTSSCDIRVNSFPGPQRKINNFLDSDIGGCGSWISISVMYVDRKEPSNNFLHDKRSLNVWHEDGVACSRSSVRY